MATKTDIFNRALREIGVTKIVKSVSDTTVEARVCSDQYPNSLNAVLEAHDWSFLSVTEELVKLTLLEANYERYMYRFAYPASCVRVRAIRASMGGPTCAYSVGRSQEASCRLISCDVLSPLCTYTKSIEDGVVLPQSFVDAVASELARNIAMPLTKSDGYIRLAEQKAQIHLTKAMQYDMSEQREPDIFSSTAKERTGPMSLINARF